MSDVSHTPQCLLGLKRPSKVGVTGGTDFVFQIWPPQKLGQHHFDQLAGDLNSFLARLHNKNN